MTTPRVVLSSEMLAAHLLRLFGEAEAANARRRAVITTPAQWAARREELLAAYRERLGSFPERTPLNPKIVGRIERDTYTIEQIIYESRPGLLVTALAYVPKDRPWPVPGVVSPCGHSENGKANEPYQRLFAGLASKGYFVLTYDPPGQGERKLYWDATTGQSRIGGCTTEHSYVGNQCFLLGFSPAQFFIWDTLRAVDYLLSRPEVDPARLAVTGNSGGGTNTAQVAPLDERLAVVAPCCYITTFAWRRRAGVTGDAEQNLVGQLPTELDHGDLLRLVAPRPLLVGSGELDYFPLEGARQSVAIAAQLYDLLGAADHLEHAIGPDPHGFTPYLRRAVYRWFNHWFDKEEEGEGEPEQVVEPDEALHCTPHGQVALENSETIWSLIRRQLDVPVADVRQPPQTATEVPAWQDSVRTAARRLTAYRDLASAPFARPADTQFCQHQGTRRVERVTLWPESDVVVPGRRWRDRAAREAPTAVVWIDEAGHEAASQRPAFQRVTDAVLPAGGSVLAVDVRGVGETAPRPSASGGRRRQQAWLMGEEPFLAYEALVAGQPLFGMRWRDVACAVAYARSHLPDADGRVVLIGWGTGALLTLHTAALDPSITATVAAAPLASYRSLVVHEHYRYPPSAFIPGVVTNPDSPHGYEVADLIGASAPRPTLVVGALDHMGTPLSADGATAAFASARSVYDLLGALAAFTLSPQPADTAESSEMIAAWVRAALDMR